jgi:hypothetical protein
VSVAAVLLRTSNFAALRHGLQKRKGNGLPYIVHPIGVAHILANEAHVDDVVVLQAALLHDVVEDTGTSIELVRSEFGSAVAGVVAEVSDDKSLGKDERKRAQIAHASTISREAKLVKLADKLYNLRDLLVTPPVGWSPARIHGYFVWALHVVAGMRGTNAVLEAELDKVFAGSISIDGVPRPVIPPHPPVAEQLEVYLADMARSND